MHRIYFDTNEGVEGGDYGLWLKASEEDIARIPGGPKDGMRVIIYMTGELEMEAILAFMPGRAVWTARPVPGTMKYLEI